MSTMTVRPRRDILSSSASRAACRRSPSKMTPSLEALEARLVLSSTWVAQGPGPIINGQDQGITSALGDNPVSGAISQVVVGSTSDILYAATVNGGVWKTTNATAATPTWVPLTDNASLAQAGQFPSLSTQSIDLSPLNANTIFAGSGRVSAFASDGGAQFGIARSTDGGSTWTVAGPTGVNIPSVVATQATVGGNEVILAGTSGGIYRSTDDGSSYSQVTVGVPAGGNVTRLVGDPGFPARFYAADSGSLYVSNDSGATWTQAADVGLNTASTDRVLLAVHNDALNDDIFAMDIDNSTGNLNAVYESTNEGATWTSLALPTTSTILQGQGQIHGAILADATNPNSFYVSGQASDDQDQDGVIFHYVAGAYQAVYGTGANGTAPHADSRGLTYDRSGNVLWVGDGGIFKLNTPTTSSDFWSSVNGTITPTDSHSAVYDPVSKIFVSGNQDNADTYQTATGSTTWINQTFGDGNPVQVDADQTAHPGTSIRYLGANGLANSFRYTFDANDNIVSTVQIPYNIISGPGAGKTIQQFDPVNTSAYQYILNRINPARMLIGTHYIYESLNKGDSVANLVNTGNQIGEIFYNTPISYGGLNADGTSNPGSFYVGSGATVYRRSADGSPIVTLGAYSGGTIDALVSDPKNVAHIFVLDRSNNVWASFDEGSTWSNLTANLGKLSPDLRSIEIFSPTNSPLNTVLLVGGVDGVFQMRRPTAAGASWTSVSSGLPKGALVESLSYEPTQNVLTVGTLGRGVWSLTNFFRGGGGTGLPNAIGGSSIGVASGSGASVSQPLSTFVTVGTSVPASEVSAIVSGPSGLFTAKRGLKPVAQSSAATTNRFGVGLLD